MGEEHSCLPTIYRSSKAVLSVLPWKNLLSPWVFFFKFMGRRNSWTHAYLCIRFVFSVSVAICKYFVMLVFSWVGLNGLPTVIELDEAAVCINSMQAFCTWDKYPAVTSVASCCQEKHDCLMNENKYLMYDYNLCDCTSVWLFRRREIARGTRIQYI